MTLVNGNLEYFRDPGGSDCVRYYKDIMELADPDNHGHYQLGLLRYGYNKMATGDYQEAKQVFQTLCSDTITDVVTTIGSGTACYHVCTIIIAI